MRKLRPDGPKGVLLTLQDGIKLILVICWITEADFNRAQQTGTMDENFSYEIWEVLANIFKKKMLSLKTY